MLEVPVESRGQRDAIAAAQDDPAILCLDLKDWLACRQRNHLAGKRLNLERQDPDDQRLGGLIRRRHRFGNGRRGRDRRNGIGSKKHGRRQRQGQGEFDQ